MLMGSSNVQHPFPSTMIVSSKLWFDHKGTNYRAWKEQMLCLIESQDLVGFINRCISSPQPPSPGAEWDNDHIQWRRIDRLLKGWILGSLRDENMVTEVAAACKDSRDVWGYLEDKFSQLQPHQDVVAAAPSATPETGASANGGTKKDLKEYLPLYRAAVEGNWVAAQKIFEDDPASITADIDSSQSKALHIAVGSTGKNIHFVKKFVEYSMRDESVLTVTDLAGNTALSIAAAAGNIEAAYILHNKMPRLLYIPNNSREFPLHLAAHYAHKDMLKYLIYVTKDDYGDLNPYGGLPGLKLLIWVIDAEFFDIALDLVNKYPDLAGLKFRDGTNALTKIAEKTSVFYRKRRRFTSLWRHLILSCVSVEDEAIALGANAADIESLVLNGQTAFRRLFTMPRKFVERLDLIKKIKGRMLLKLQALKLVKRLCKKIESLNFGEAKEICFDAIMIAAESGISEIVEEIVEVFPSALGFRTVGSLQYIFHVAVQNRSEQVFNLFYYIMNNHKHFYCDEEDAEGNNVLHLAGKLAPPHKLNDIPGAALQMQRELQWYMEVRKFVHPHARNRPNHAGKSPHDVFTEEHKILKEQGEKWMKDTSNSCTIAAALIATVMFAAAITVPGGNDSSNGLPILYKSLHTSPAFVVFAVSDAVSLFTSVTSLLMFLAILTSRYAEEDFLYVLPTRLIIGLGTLFLSITFMMVAFSAAIYLVFGRNRGWVLIPVGGLAALPVTSFVLLQFPLFLDLISSTYGRGIFGKRTTLATSVHNALLHRL